MREEIRQQLNEINREFYRVTTDAFDQTRSHPWEGWRKLLVYLPPMQDGFRVLDIGCGNGRFGVFLAEQYPQRTLLYHGIDSSAELLERAQIALDKYRPRLIVNLEQRDILETGLPTVVSQYDLVVLFGVLHHIPGFVQRQAFIRELGKQVKPGGILAFTVWRFYEFERFRSRIVPWPPQLAEQVETHDYLLDWRRSERALRYCHYVDTNELEMIIESSRKQAVARFTADGKDEFNRYIILGNF
jgi:tRNA (uracil-5-)-methyltransferase TRM9